MKNYTNLNYMKDLLAGDIPHMKINDVYFVKVPFYTELEPDKIIADWKLDNN